MTPAERQALVDQLILHESMRLKPYTDEFGNVTIGIGRNLTGKGISSAEAFYLLGNDIDEVEADLLTFPWFHGLDPIRQRVLRDMRFNLGHGKFRTFLRTIRLVSEGDYAAAASAMRSSAWARQVKSRADRLIDMMRTGVDYA